jgi:hypothetical protein
MKKAKPNKEPNECLIHFLNELWKDMEMEDIYEAKLALREIEEEGSIPFEEMKRRLG